MKRLHLILCLSVLFPASVLFGQKPGADGGPVGIFPSQAEYNQFMGNAKRAAYGENGTAEMKAMIPMLNDIALNKPVGWTANEYGVEGSQLGLLSNPKIREDLEMMDDQYQKYQDMESEIQKRAAEEIRNLDFSDTENFVAKVRGIRSQANSDLEGVLLPHQLERLLQIRFQSQLRRRSLVEILTSDPIKSTLEITDDQSDDLHQAEEKIKADLEKEIAKLREKARDRLLSELSPSQKAKAEKMIGETFAFPTSSKERGKRKNSKDNGKSAKGYDKSAKGYDKSAKGKN